MTLRLPRFAYIAPRSVAEAAEILDAEGPRAMLVAGGTDLYPNMKRRQFTPEILVGLRNVPEMRGIRPLDSADTEGPRGGVRIGAGVTLTDVGSHERIRERYPALSTAASLVSTPQLRNMGTIGGNICLDTRCNWYDQSAFWRKAVGYCMKLPAASPSLVGEVRPEVPCRVAHTSPRCLATFSADTVPALIGYDATVRLVDAGGERTVALRELYEMDGMHWLKIRPGEILTEVRLPDPEGLRATYLKLRDRESFDFPMAGVFVGIRTDGSGLVDRARMVLTGVYSRPVELTEAEDVVLGQRLEPDVIAAAAEAAYEASRPVDNTGGTIIQRRRTIRVFVRRALQELAANG